MMLLAGCDERSSHRNSSNCTRDGYFRPDPYPTDSQNPLKTLSPRCNPQEACQKHATQTRTTLTHITAMAMPPILKWIAMSKHQSTATSALASRSADQTSEKTSEVSPAMLREAGHDHGSRNGSRNEVAGRRTSPLRRRHAVPNFPPAEHLR